VVLNGVLGGRICHESGLRQGDPLSPMFFLLIMEVLNALICKEDSWSLLQPLGVCAIPYRTPLYAYDLDVFISSIAQDLQMARSMLSLFEGASVLGCNMNKCQMAPIRCDAE
jgi:hypothetical protein